MYMQNVYTLSDISSDQIVTGVNIIDKSIKFIFRYEREEIDEQSLIQTEKLKMQITI